MGNLGLLNVTLCFLLVACSQVYGDSSCDSEISDTLRVLLNPDENDSIQVQALRRQLLRKLQDLDERAFRRDLAYLAAWSNLPDEHKRNLEALARAGTWYKNPPEQDDDSNYKRSIAYLAKNGQPPLMPLPLENQKRGIEALARNGDLLHRQTPQDLRTILEALYGKRNVAYLARIYPNTKYDKRSISSLAKTGDLPYAYGKRSIQSLARDGVLGKKSDYIDAPQDKRNIQAIKAQQRNKRQADYFNNELVYQLPTDYEDELQDLETAAQDAYPVEDKRFLGRIPQMGKPRTTAIPKSRRYH